MAEPSSKKQRKDRISKPQHKKLAKLPPNATVSKRPLNHPAIPSPYAGASQQKIVYVSARTPFLSAVKRVEKLLQLSDKRLVQSATTHAKQNGGRKRKRTGDEDEVLDIAREVERQKAVKRRKGEGDEEGVEQVTVKGTGKAIQKCLKIALWFQQREQYDIRLKTRSVGAIDDIEVNEQEEEPGGDGKDRESAENRGGDDVEDSATAAKTGPSQDDVVKALEASSDPPEAEKKSMGEDIPETRVRYLSVLEVAVSLR